MSTPGNTSMLGTAHSNIQTAQSCPTLVGIEPSMYYYQHSTESAHYPTISPPMNKLCLSACNSNLDIKNFINLCIYI